MRILIVTNFYPPHHVGGYELGCRDVVEGLRQRQHVVEVLTSRYGVDRSGFNDTAWRELRHGYKQPSPRSPAHYVCRLLDKELTNLIALRHSLRRLRPDVVYFWNLWTSSIGLVQAAQRLGIPTAHYSSDLSLHNWEGDEWYAFVRQAGPSGFRALPRRVVRLLTPRLGLLSASDSVRLQTVHFASEFLAREMRAAGKPVADASVIHWGVRPDRALSDEHLSREPERWLYAGRISPEKGVHTAIEALGRALVRQPGRPATLTIAGPTTATGYDTQLLALVDRLGLDKHVHWKGAIPRAELSSTYRSHDVFVFPSVWQEPFSIALLEAMAAGMAIVTTHTGGTPEIAIHEHNALVFPAEDATACAEQITRLSADTALRRGLRARAQTTIRTTFSLDGMVDRIEERLLRVANASR